MKIGIPKEIKSKEYRVGIIPSGVKVLADLGWKEASLQNSAIYSGVNVVDCYITEEAAAKSLDLEYRTLKEILI